MAKSHLTRLLIATLIFALYYGAAVAQEKRVALLIGNSGYQHAPNLPNPANDASDLANSLERIGFDVNVVLDADFRQMRVALRDFAEGATEADVALVYFAGHGIEIDNTNYLIPVNAELKTDRDIELESLRLDTITRALAESRGLKIVLVDACRTNPFVSEMRRTSATRSIGRGLRRMDPDGGVLVGYAARAGTLALDGDGRNSPYATALLQHIEEPGLELGKMFRNVRDTVQDLTDGIQEPFTYGSLPGRDIFLAGQTMIMQDFEVASASGGVAAWDEFLSRHESSGNTALINSAIRLRDAAHDREAAASERARLAEEAKRAKAEQHLLEKEAELAKAESQRLAKEAAEATAGRERLKLEAERARAERERLALEATLAQAGRDRLAAEAAAAEQERIAAERAKAAAEPEIMAALPTGMPNSPGGVLTDAAIEKEDAAFQAAKKLNTPRAWAHFFNEFPRSKWADNALQLEARKYREIMRTLATAFGDANVLKGMRKASIGFIGLTRSEVLAIQSNLVNLGYQPGAVDGTLGERSYAAIASFQSDRGFLSDGVIDRPTLASLDLPSRRGNQSEWFKIASPTGQRYAPALLKQVESDKRVIKLVSEFPSSRMTYGFFDGRLYAVVHTGAFGLASELATSLAENAGGGMAIIDSRVENSFVIDLFRFDSFFWKDSYGGEDWLAGPSIGLFKNDGASRVWRWHDGSQVTYSAWLPGFPKSRRRAKVAEFRVGDRSAKIGTSGWGWADNHNARTSLIFEIE